MELQMQPQEQLLAQGKPQKKGDFKYGLRVIDVSTDEELYDDDPRLIII